MNRAGQSGIATGVLVALLGIWVVARTVTHDDQGQNLVDKILGLDSGSSSSSSSSTTAGLGLHQLGNAAPTPPPSSPSSRRLIRHHHSWQGP